MFDQYYAETIANKWIENWNNHDLEAILSHYAEDIEFSSPFIVKLLGDENGKISGKNALRDYFAKGLVAYPDLKFELLTTLKGVDSVVLYYRSVNNLLAAEYMEINTDGLISRVVAHYS